MPRLLLVSMLGFAFVCHLQADEAKLNPDPKIKPEARKEEKPAEDKKPKESSTTGAVSINGKPVNYQATAAMLPILKPEDGKPKAQVFYTAYTMADKTDAAKRPVTFCFNGGPGSSSVWLHLGAFGSKTCKPSCRWPDAAAATGWLGAE